MARSLHHYATHHKFDYPKFGKVVEARSNRKLFRHAARGEDSAYTLYRALKHNPGSQKYHHLIHNLKEGNVGKAKTAQGQAIRRKMERQPVMGSKGRPQYGGAGLSRAKAEKVVGNALSKLSGVKQGKRG